MHNTLVRQFAPNGLSAVALPDVVRTRLQQQSKNWSTAANMVSQQSARPFLEIVIADLLSAKTIERPFLATNFASTCTLSCPKLNALFASTELDGWDNQGKRAFIFDLYNAVYSVFVVRSAGASLEAKMKDALWSPKQFESTFAAEDENVGRVLGFALWRTIQKNRKSSKCVVDLLNRLTGSIVETVDLSRNVRRRRIIVEPSFVFTFGFYLEGACIELFSEFKNSASLSLFWVRQNILMSPCLRRKWIEGCKSNETEIFGIGRVDGVTDDDRTSLFNTFVSYYLRSRQKTFCQVNELLPQPSATLRGSLRTVSKKKV